jgi:hypothetical protein
VVNIATTQRNDLVKIGCLNQVVSNGKKKTVQFTVENFTIVLYNMKYTIINFYEQSRFNLTLYRRSADRFI